MLDHDKKTPATFYVVPVVPVDPIDPIDPIPSGQTEFVLFFEDDGHRNGKDCWRRIAATDLNARRQHRDAGKIRLVQPARKKMETILKNTGVNREVDLYVEMCAGVARTLHKAHDHHITYHVADDGDDGKKQMDIPVKANEPRALVLVFTRFAGRDEHGKLCNAIGLIATQDPEIKNSTGGCGDPEDCAP